MATKKAKKQAEPEYKLPIDGTGQPVADAKKSDACSICGKAVKQTAAHTVTGAESCHVACLRGAGSVFGRNLMGLRKKYSVKR